MHRPIAIALRWAGRGLVLLGPFIVVCALFLPAGVQWLNPLVCDEGLELSNARDTPRGQPDDAKLEIVCTNSTYSTSAAQRVLLVAVGSIATGLAMLYLSQRLLSPRRRTLSGPPPP